jgi:hypothetical protein
MGLTWVLWLQSGISTISISRIFPHPFFIPRHYLPFVQGSLCRQHWLPDGISSNQKSIFWYLLEGLEIDNVGISYGHLVYFTAICYRYAVWLFGIFPPFWYVVKIKIWQPCRQHRIELFSNLVLKRKKPFSTVRKDSTRHFRLAASTRVVCV